MDLVEIKTEVVVLVRRRSIRLPVEYCECGRKLQVITTKFYCYKYSNTYFPGTQKLWSPGIRRQNYRMNFGELLADICMVITRVPGSGGNICFSICDNGMSPCECNWRYSCKTMVKI